MNDIVNANMNEYWNGEGGQKWLRFQERMDVHLLPFGQKVIDEAAISAGEAILDVGCGCGDTAIRMAREAGPDGRVLGVDISEPILARARTRAESASHKNVSFETADAQTHRFAEAAFDLVVSRFGVMFFDDSLAAFRNIRRALKPGGRMVFICWQGTKENEWIRKPLEVIGLHVPLPEPPGPEEPGPTAFCDSARVKRILSGAGFSDIAITSCDTAFSLGNGLDNAVEFAMQMGPASGAIVQSEADEATKSRIAADMCEALAAHETPDGIVLGAATWLVSARNS